MNRQSLVSGRINHDDETDEFIRVFRAGAEEQTDSGNSADRKLDWMNASMSCGASLERKRSRSITMFSGPGFSFYDLN